MPGQLNSMKSRKRKSSSKGKSSRKAIPTRRRCLRSPKRHHALESSSRVSSSCGKAEGLSLITCECHQSAGRRRCSASPELEGQEGKENELRTEMDTDSCRVNGVSDMDCDETSKNIFPDDDSNQILPVEQFFGNLDTVKDFPQRSSRTSTHSQRGNRRRHYYAPEDSDEEEVGLGSAQEDKRRDISDM